MNLSAEERSKCILESQLLGLDVSPRSAPRAFLVIAPKEESWLGRAEGQDSWALLPAL